MSGAIGSSGQGAPRPAVELLISLHAHKNKGYGDAWRRRGELLSIFTNLARKYDRLVVALDEDTRSADERLPDTVGDLCVYAGKYLTWLAEQHPDAFDAVSRGASSEECSDAGRPDALERVLLALEFDGDADAELSWAELKRAFVSLDVGLMAQAECEGAERLGWEEKVRLAWGLASSSAALLVALSDEEPDAWSAWRAEVEALG
jgi:hypothetical protein